MKRILLIDDDIAIGSLLTLALQESGYTVHFQSSMFGVMEITEKFEPNLIVLDVEVGEENSIDRLPELLAVSNSTPIIFISSHHESELVVSAISGGGTLYLKKPFSTSELIAYAEKLCTANEQSKVLQFGNSTLYIADRNLQCPTQSDSVKLGKKEFSVLRLLALEPNNIVKREEIINFAFDSENVSEHSLNNIICRLRASLASDLSLSIQTVHGIGYRLNTNIKPNNIALNT